MKCTECSLAMVSRASPHSEQFHVAPAVRGMPVLSTRTHMYSNAANLPCLIHPHHCRGSSARCPARPQRLPMRSSCRRASAPSSPPSTGTVPPAAANLRPWKTVECKPKESNHPQHRGALQRTRTPSWRCRMRRGCAWTRWS